LYPKRCFLSTSSKKIFSLRFILDWTISKQRKMSTNLVFLVLLILFESTTANSGTCGKVFESRGFIIGGSRLQTIQRNDFPW
jgi:hypothetical protein